MMYWRVEMPFVTARTRATGLKDTWDSEGGDESHIEWYQGAT